MKTAWMVMLFAGASLWHVAGASAQFYTVYSPVVPVYAPPAPVVSYYPPAPITTYYPPAPVTAYYGPAPVTSYYAPAYAPGPVPVTAYYGGPVPFYAGRPVIARTKFYVPGQPVRNAFRAIGP